MVKIGEKVEDFEVEAYHNEEVKKVKLSDYKGKWVVMLFYPGDFTFVCPTELSDAADLYDDFVKEGAEVLSVSTDTVFVHKAWHDNSTAIRKVRYPMLSDPTGKVCRQFGTYISADDDSISHVVDEGQSLRGSFIISPEGKLVVMDIHDNSVGRNAAELLRKLQASKFVRENKGQVCPANWKPGEKTLKPGLDLVGKI